MKTAILNSAVHFIRRIRLLPGSWSQSNRLIVFSLSFDEGLYLELYHRLIIDLARYGKYSSTDAACKLPPHRLASTIQ